MTAEQLQQRQLETRRYEGITEDALLSACSNLLQDMGYNLENSESELGVLTASKKRDASDPKEFAVALLGALVGVSVPLSVDQTIRVALVTRPSYDSEGKSMADSHHVRVTFQREVRLTNGTTRAETLNDQTLYEEFYDQLSKAVFLEAQKI
ncbi:hypothetical protein EBQ25_03155 [Allofranklinella schreckenbergeri]|uniref:Uncharacterized protein n=1 Tax=Allofranklinella schreckenbergeri TaxID=1076744 RepID=A0A3M6QG45_9BURK|nr:hypothetical protein EBQ25_03155 [Allofranklinella schreckenbergeri]